MHVFVTYSEIALIYGASGLIHQSDYFLLWLYIWNYVAAKTKYCLHCWATQSDMVKAATERATACDSRSKFFITWDSVIFADIKVDYILK